MPRLRILELPMEHIGEHSRTPFAVVIDRCIPESDTYEAVTKGDMSGMKSALNADAVLVFRDEIELEP